MRSPRISTLAFLMLSLCFDVAFAQCSSLHGIDVAELAGKPNPCNNFYNFAKGTWRANNPIPASMTRWSKRWQAGETSKDKLRDILEASSADRNAPKGSTEQIIG